MFVRVKGSGLKSAFNDAYAILKKNDYTNSIGLTVSGNQLLVTIDSSIRYQKSVPIESKQDTVSTTYPVTFKNIAPFLPAREEIKLEFLSYGVVISCEGFESTLYSSDVLIHLYKGLDIGVSKMSFLDFAAAVSKLSNTNVVTKWLKQQKPFRFCYDYAYISFPTVWVRVKSSGVNCTLSQEYAKIISSFEPTGVRTDNSIIEFVKEDAVLAIPASIPSDMVEFQRKLDELEYVVPIDGETLYTQVQKMCAALDPTDVELEIYEEGLCIRAKTPTGDISKTIGSLVTKACSVKMPLPYLKMVLSMLDRVSVELRYNKEEDVVCWNDTGTFILMSVN